MTQQNIIYTYSSLSMAAYSELNKGNLEEIESIYALKVDARGNPNMTESQAKQFAKNISSVIAVSGDSPSGFSATAFQGKNSAEFNSINVFKLPMAAYFKNIQWSDMR